MRRPPGAPAAPVSCACGARRRWRHRGALVAPERRPPHACSEKGAACPDARPGSGANVGTARRRASAWSRGLLSPARTRAARKPQSGGLAGASMACTGVSSAGHEVAVYSAGAPATRRAGPQVVAVLRAGAPLALDSTRVALSRMRVLAAAWTVATAFAVWRAYIRGRRRLRDGARLAAIAFSWRHIRCHSRGAG